MDNPRTTLLAPSILAGDHANLGTSLRIVEQTGLEWVHLDIMDGHFVPNLTFGPQTVCALRPTSKLFFDVHLMLEKPHEFVEPFIEAGADQITIHVEPDYPVAETLLQIKDKGICCGVVLNPDTPAKAAEPFLPLCDIVLLMTVQPGFGGQSFRQDVLPKIETLANWRTENGFDYRLQVDGGIDLSTAPLCTSLGVDTLVAGTAFFQATDKEAFACEITA